MINEKAAEIQRKWNIPDWLDELAYPRSQEISDTLWRWEFLRRRADYRQDWEAYFQKTYEYEVACSKDPSFPTKYKKKVMRWDNVQFRATVPHSLEKYHLIALPNPSVQNPAMLSFDSNYGRIYFGQGPDWVAGGEEVTLRLPEWKVATVFDLKKPLSPQIEKVKKDLMEWQAYQMGKKLERRKSRQEWTTYLRILDAREVGASDDEVGMELLEIEDPEVADARVQQLHKAATQLSYHFPN